MIALVARWLIARNPAMTVRYARRLASLALFAVAVILVVLAASWWSAGKVETGRVEQRAASAEQTLTNVRKANDAAETVRRDGGPSRDDCLRDSRTPENC